MAAANTSSAPPTFPTYRNYQRLPSMVLAFHGCDRKVGEDVLSGKTRHLTKSVNQYDWLGNGIYFWENDPRRAMEWAVECQQRPKQTKGHINDPFVVGAVVELGFCLNMLSREGVEEAVFAHTQLKEVWAAAGSKMPENTGTDNLIRRLDKAVIDMVHRLRSESKVPLVPYDTVRAMFKEGEPIYDGAGFEKKNHIQLAVLNESCIKGYFRPFED